MAQQTIQGLAIDTSRAYGVHIGKGGAGQCDKCGYFKTWGFKINNPKTGNQVPGHVTEQGFKIGNGECPFYIVKGFIKPGTVFAAPEPPEGQREVIDIKAIEKPIKTQAAFPTAQEIFQLSPDDKRIIENVKRAIVQSISDDLREVIAILREIRDGKSRAQLNTEAAGAVVHAPDPTSGHR